MDCLISRHLDPAESMLGQSPAVQVVRIAAQVLAKSLKVV